MEINEFISFQVFTQYIGNPEATAAAKTSDGWFYTGDIGMVDEDGNVTLVDRLKEIIKCGFNLLVIFPYFPLIHVNNMLKYSMMVTYGGAAVGSWGGGWKLGVRREGYDGNNARYMRICGR